MTETQEVFFDANSGISVEEQREILSKINGIDEEHRRSLSDSALGLEPGIMPVINAKKSGAFFPLAVNIAALLILAAGAFLLISFNGKKDAQVRTGTVVYDLTERALIDEIRKDTAERLATKEQEIASMNSRIEDIDAELSQLHSNNQNLTAEQRAAQERLLAMQNSYRENLSALQEERSNILEDARSKEARLRAQLEERAKEFAAAQQHTSGELDRMTKEQDRAAAIDAQMAGGFAFVSSLVQEGQYEEAARTLDNLRDFCSGSQVAGKSFQSRREFYIQTINSLEAVVYLARGFGGGTVNLNAAKDLQTKNTQLEEKLAEMQKTIDAFSSGSSGQNRRLSELEENVSSMRDTISSLETSAAGKDRTISSLEGDKASLNQTVSDLKSVNSDQEREIDLLRSQLATIRQALQE